MEKVLRSFIHEHFDLDLRVQIELIGRRRDLNGPGKRAAVIQLLQDRGIDNFVKLGPGTNRYAFKLDGFVVKVATDSDGKIDNLKEFKMAKRLFPDVSKTYEVATNGDLLVAEYIQPFASYSEMLKYAPKIRAILNKWKPVYLVGDVGISSINYGNWGLRVGSDNPVCLDFAYVYATSSSVFVCRECRTGMLVPDEDFNILRCTKCNKTKKFSDLRALIGNDVHQQEIGDLTEEGYEMRSSYVKTILTEERSNYLQNKKKEEDDKEPEVQDEEVNDFNIIKEEEDMSNMSKLSEQLLAQNPEAFRGGITIIPTSVIAAEEAPEGMEIVGVTPAVKEVKDTVVTHRVEVTTVPAEEVETLGEPDTVAFSGKIDHDTSPVVIDSEAIDVNDEPEEDPRDVLKNPSFINNFNGALSKLSNRIAWDLRCMNLYDDVKIYIKDSKMLPKTFYENLQNAMYHSLAAFCGCTTQHDVPNRNSQGTHKEYDTPKAMFDTAYEPTLIFMARMWTHPLIIKANDEDHPSESLNCYAQVYEDYFGIQNEWLAVFRERLSKKLYMATNGVDDIVSVIISRGWCLPYISDKRIEEDEDTFDPNEEEDSEDSLEKIEKEIEEELTADDVEYISVEIYRNAGLDEETDIVKLISSDNIGDVIIPFYTKLDDIDITKPLPASIIDDRNGEWEWLLYLIPDVRFTTEDPDKWLAVNDPSYDKPNEDRTRIVIHDIVKVEGRTVYIMAVYVISDILIDIHDKYAQVYDEELLSKLWRLFRQDLAITNIGTYQMVQANTSMIRDESYMDSKVKEEDIEEEENQEEGEDESYEDAEGYSIPDEEEEESNNMDVEVLETAGSSNELEEAALRNMMGESNDQEDPATEPEEADDIMVYGYLEEDRRNKSVKRTFYRDFGHTEKIQGVKGKTYIDISEEKAGTPNYMAAYIWTGGNFVKAKDQPSRSDVQNQKSEDKDEDTIHPQRRVETTKDNVVDENDMIIPKRRTSKK